MGPLIGHTSNNLKPSHSGNTYSFAIFANFDVKKVNNFEKPLKILAMASNQGLTCQLFLRFPIKSSPNAQCGHLISIDFDDF